MLQHRLTKSKCTLVDVKSFMHIELLDHDEDIQVWRLKLYAHRASVNRFWRSWSFAKPICMHIVQLCQQRGGQWWQPKLYIHWSPAKHVVCTLMICRAKLYIHWAISEPQWHRERCLKKQHRKKKWHWFTAGVTEVKFKYHFIITWVYYNYTTLTTCKTAKLLFSIGKKVKCWRFHTAGVASSKLASPTKNTRKNQGLSGNAKSFFSWWYVDSMTNRL